MRKLINVRRMKGQAMVLFLGFAAAVVGIMLVSFNAGQVTNAKMRAMNAADAAAYSGAVWQARSLNFQAYMNRAMIVNEVTIAQSVSLRSWLAYVDRLVANVQTVTQWIPYFGAAITAVKNGLEQVDRATQTALGVFEDGNRALNQIEHAAQVGFNAQGVIIAHDIAAEVAQKNGAELSPANNLLWARDINDWFAFTETYSKTKRPSIASSGDGRARLRAVTLDSRDGFTRERDHEFDFLLLGFRKQGGTDLVDYDAWKGLDSAHLCTRPFFGKSCKYTSPLGWGGAQAYSTAQPVGNIGKHGDVNNWGTIDGRAARLAAMSTAAATPRANSLNRVQFPNYRDVQNFDTKNPNANALPFAVEVVIKGDAIPTANSDFQAKVALTDGTLLEHDPQYVDRGGVFAMAEACVRFERPFDHPRAGNGREFPSLFNPYWRASLATEDWKSRSIVDGWKKLVPISAITAGKGSCRA